ncbi:hypothetical protein BC830DRAFT_1077623 [Chytriomyces sp. MP71]|nr:hypothetical protein BC830DRAFT_1077623 [Chytriomyces sp. MP71]
MFLVIHFHDTPRVPAASDFAAVAHVNIVVGTDDREGDSALCKIMTVSTLIPLEYLFGNPEYVNSTGNRIAFLAPKGGLLNLFVKDRDHISDLLLAQPITNDNVRGIRDKGEDEDWKAYSVNVVTGKEMCLTPTDKTNNMPSGVSHDFPDYMLISSNKRDTSVSELLLVNIHTTEDQLLIENDSGFAEFTVDHKFYPFVATKIIADSSVDLSYAKLDIKSKVVNYSKVFSKRVDGTQTEHTEESHKSFVPVIASFTASTAKHVLHIAYEDSGYGDTGVRGFCADLNSVYVATYFTYIGSDPKSNIANESLIHPITHELLAYVTNYDMKRYVAVNPDDTELAADFAALTAEAGPTERLIRSTSIDFTVWSVEVTKSDSPFLNYIYDRSTKTPKLFFDSRPVLVGYQLNKMRAVDIITRDGLNMLAYLTIPKHVDGVDGQFPTGPVPLVALVHGGPYHRDEFGFDKIHHSGVRPGLKDFLNAATGEWPGKMHDDIIDTWNESVMKADPKGHHKACLTLQRAKSGWSASARGA